MKPPVLLFLAVAFLWFSTFSETSPADSLPPLKSIKIRKIPDGAADYGRFCSFCHGATGAGDGLNAFNLPIRPRNFTDSTAFRNSDPDHLFKVISNGGAANRLSRDMPPWDTTLDSVRIGDLVQYIRYLRIP